MAKAFFTFNAAQNDVQERDDKILPDPIVLGPVTIILDGKEELITATSGQLQYVLVKPSEVAQDWQERKLRTGSIRA